MAFTFDTATVVDGIGVGLAAVGIVGVAKLGVDAALLAFRTVLDLIDGGHRTDINGGEPDPWDGYTAADDARDRAAAGLHANPAWLESAREHAMQMQLTGEGQSAAYAEAERRDDFDADWMAFEREQEGGK